MFFVLHAISRDIIGKWTSNALANRAPRILHKQKQLRTKCKDSLWITTCHHGD